MAECSAPDVARTFYHRISIDSMPFTAAVPMMLPEYVHVHEYDCMRLLYISTLLSFSGYSL